MVGYLLKFLEDEMKRGCDRSFKAIAKKFNYQNLPLKWDTLKIDLAGNNILLYHLDKPFFLLFRCGFLW
ncbi:hypothetical protein [Nostoc commune]|uniref:hypothetical protein n=1 Tax=Nostoc commune TaxID=1178 RepID=UPI002072B1A8|nr:hypothetical protein [Nostoc commune]